MAGAFPLSGQIDPKAFPFLLMDLHRQGATGSLKVEGPSYQKALYYRSGRILFGSSNDPRDQLGAILIEDGKITPEQLEDVNAKVGPGNPLAKVLADSGVVSQRELSEAARAKVERILSDIFAYESGSFEFEDGVLPKGAVDLKLSTERLVFASVRRVADRGFVLRHLGGLDTVLAKTGDFDAHAAEVAGDAGGLPGQLDGRRTLKDAAAGARLDEFDAAKIACALVFLGMVRRAERKEESGQLVESPVFVAPKEDESGLDLAGTARLAFENEPMAAEEPAPSVEQPAMEAAAEAAPFFTPEAEPLVLQSEPQAVVAEPEPESATAPTLVFAPEAEAEPGAEIAVAPAVPSFAPEPEPEPEPEIAVAPPPPPPRPEPRPAPVAPPPPPAPAARSAPPLKPPPPRRAPDIPVPAAPAVSRPSKNDLAALDSLLNLQSVEGPLAPLEKSPPRDEPRFGQPPRGRSARRGRSVNPMLIGAVAVLLLAGAGGGVYYLRGLGAHARPATAPARKPSPAVTLAAASPPPVSTPPATTAAQSPPPPAAAPVTSPPAKVAPTPAATPSASAPRAAAASSGANTLAQARDLLHKGQLQEAARAFAAHVRTAAGVGWSVQILVACSDDTVRKAVENVSAQELYIVPVNFKGRDCYRLCWGLYETESRASAAEHDVPAYFRNGGAKPKVVATPTILP